MRSITARARPAADVGSVNASRPSGPGSGARAWSSWRIAAISSARPNRSNVSTRIRSAFTRPGSRSSSIRWNPGRLADVAARDGVVAIVAGVGPGVAGLRRVRSMESNCCSGLARVLHLGGHPAVADVAMGPVRGRSGDSASWSGPFPWGRSAFAEDVDRDLAACDVGGSAGVVRLGEVGGVGIGRVPNPAGWPAPGPGPGGGPDAGCRCSAAVAGIRGRSSWHGPRPGLWERAAREGPGRPARSPASLGWAVAARARGPWASRSERSHRVGPPARRRILRCGPAIPVRRIASRGRSLDLVLLIFSPEWRLREARFPRNGLPMGSPREFGLDRSGEFCYGTAREDRFGAGFDLPASNPGPARPVDGAGRRWSGASGEARRRSGPSSGPPSKTPGGTRPITAIPGSNRRGGSGPATGRGGCSLG